MHVDDASHPEPELRIGIGHDTHRLGSGGPLILGGVRIDCDRHLIGHSDADVLLHAITDALLGAANLGDIGELFPDTDPANRDRDSMQMLQQVCERLEPLGFRIQNLDCIVFAEQPKLSPYKAQICTTISNGIGLAVDRINVKAKTGEGVDAIGHGLAISAQCIALLKRSHTPATF